MEAWRDYLASLLTGLDAVIATGSGGDRIDTQQAFDDWVRLTREGHDQDRGLFFIGNGGSAMIASHMAVDACKNGELRALALNDPAFLTAIGNDIAFEEVFALPLRRLARRGDLLITISTSGNSPDIVSAIGAARDLGMRVVTLSGRAADNRSRAMGDLNFYVPVQRYGWVESAHQVLIHYWFDQYLNRHGRGAA